MEVLDVSEQNAILYRLSEIDGLYYKKIYRS